MLALHYAARTGDLKRLRKELAAGVDVDTPYRESTTALHDAAHNGQTACLKALLAAGASVHDVSPLIDASLFGHAACVRALIAAGSDVNRKDLEGKTPFSRALWHGRPRVLKILLRAGADVDTRDMLRLNRNADAWALVDQIRADGGWANYVARHLPTTFASIVFKATHGELPAPLPLEIAAFLVPPGGF